MTKIAASLALAALLLVSSAHAQLEDLQPRVSFSGLRVITAGGRVMEGPYYYAPQKHRSEMTLEGQTVTGIVREDRQLLWTLMPQQNMYIEVSFDSRDARSGSAFEGAQVVESREVGTETVNGQRTTKYEVTVRDPSGTTASGTIWATSDRIPVKMDMLVDGGERVVVELKDIKIGPQPDSLFEVPAGYTALSLGSLGGLQDFARAFSGAAQPSGAAQSVAPTQPAAPTQPTAPAGSSGPSFVEEVVGEAAEGAKEAVTDGVRDGVRDNVGRKIRGLFNR